MTFSKKTDLVWLIGMTSAISNTLLASFVFPEAGKFLIYTTVLFRILLYWGTGRTPWGNLYGELLVMGLVAGAVELPTDYFLVHWTNSGQLVYTTGSDVVLLASPLYMPFAWATVITEFGYLILRLGNLLSNVRMAALLGSLTAGITIGFYEFFAFKAGWWYYKPARVMLGAHCALTIPVAEFLMFLTFFPIFNRPRRLRDGQLRAVVRGSLFGFSIFAAYALAYLILELH